MKGAERIYVYPEFTHSCTEKGKGDVGYVREDLAIERLARIMITFDLATGHADTMDEILDSLESELRDVLGYYREALRNANQEPANDEPVAWVNKEELDNPISAFVRTKHSCGPCNTPLYLHPQEPKKPMTEEDRKQGYKDSCPLSGASAHLSFYYGIRFAEKHHGIGEEK